MSKLKNCIKTTQGTIELAIEAKKEEKPELTPKTTFYLYKRSLDLLSIKNEKLQGLFLSCSNSKKVFVYDLENNQHLPFISLDCTNLVVTRQKLRKKGLESRVEILIGFETGEVITYSFSYSQGSHLDSKKETFNAEKQNDNTAVSSLLWRDSDTFLVAHESGNIYVFHREYKTLSPIQSQEQTGDYYVIQNSKEKMNPITKISLMKERIYDMKYSHDGKYLALVTAKGYLYVLKSDDFKIIIVFKSYFGGLLCLDWSHDSKYIVVGGEDDSIMIVSPSDECIIARGINGHKAYVSSVIFDDTNGEDNYRIISTGEDGYLSVWELDKPTELEKTPSININDVLLIQCTSKIQTFDPFSSQKIHLQPIGDILLFKDGYITFCFDNIFKIWLKPNHQFKIIPKIEKIQEKK